MSREKEVSLEKKVDNHREDKFKVRIMSGAAEGHELISRRLGGQGISLGGGDI